MFCQHIFVHNKMNCGRVGFRSFQASRFSPGFSLSVGYLNLVHVSFTPWRKSWPSHSDALSSRLIPYLFTIHGSHLWNSASCSRFWIGAAKLMESVPQWGGQRQGHILDSSPVHYQTHTRFISIKGRFSLASYFRRSAGGPFGKRNESGAAVCLIGSEQLSALPSVG